MANTTFINNGFVIRNIISSEIIKILIIAAAIIIFSTMDITEASHNKAFARQQTN
jgi:hypothetical protein